MADKLTVEHYIAECFVKCAQVILNARIHSSSAKLQEPDKRASKWFLLQIDEVDSAKAELDQWRRDISSPLVIEVYLQPWGNKAIVASRDGQPQSSGAGEMLLERWTLQYVRGLGGLSRSGSMASGASRTNLDEASVYKRLIILVRSLHSYVRLLPAYRMYRTCKRYPGEQLALGYRLMRPGQGQAARGAAPSAPGATEISGGGGGGGPPRPSMMSFAFTPVEAQTGAFRVSVEFQPSATVHILEQTTAPPAIPRIISDYIAQPPSAPGPLPGTSAPAASSGALSRAAAAAAAAPGGHLPPGQERQLVQGHQAIRHSLSSSLAEGQQQQQQGQGSEANGHAGPPRPAPAMTVQRQSWSSREVRMEIPQLASPGGLQAGGGGHRRVSSGYVHGTPPSPSYCLRGQPQPRGPALPPQYPYSQPLPHHTASLPKDYAGMAAAATAISNGPAGTAVARPAGAAGVAQGPGSGSGAGTSAAGGQAGVAGPAGIVVQHSAPVGIPKSQRHRSPSVHDLHTIYDFPADQDLPAAAPRPPPMPATTAAASTAAATSRMAAGSAPAAPRGMLGQALVAQRQQQLQLKQAGALGQQAGLPPLHPQHPQPSGPGPLQQQQHAAQPVGSGSASSPQGQQVPAGAGAGAGAGPSAGPIQVVPSRPRGVAPYPASSGDGSSAAGSLPAAGSPSLPFAFTPQGQSLASLHQHFTGPPPAITIAQQQGGAGAMAPPAVPVPGCSPPVSGRDISALATIRRPSWSSKSSSYDVANGTMVHGMSVSPLQDLLESSLSVSMSSSTRLPNTFSPVSPPVWRRHHHLPPGLSPSPRQQQQKLVQVGEAPDHGSPGGGGPQSAGSHMDGPDTGGIPDLMLYAEPGMLLAEESEGDLLPFALDHEPAPQPAPAALTEASGGQPALYMTTGGMDRDAALGAFIRMMQEAPPLSLLPTDAAACQQGLGQGSQLQLDSGSMAGLTHAGAALTELNELRQKIQRFLATEC